MDYKKKLKLRLCIDLIWALVGVALILYWFLADSGNNFFLSWGTACLFIGVIRFIQYRETTGDEDTLRKKELAEKDERTRMIAERARSWCFYLSITGAGIWVIVLNLMGRHEEATPFAWYVCGMLVLYLICFAIIRKKY